MLTDSLQPTVYGGSAMADRTEVVNPLVYELVALGNAAGSTKMSAPTRGEIRENLRKAFTAAKERATSYASTPCR